MLKEYTPSASEAELVTAQDALIDQVTASQQEALDTMETAGQAVFEGLTRVQHEIAEFVAERIRQDMETQQELPALPHHRRRAPGADRVLPHRHRPVLGRGEPADEAQRRDRGAHARAQPQQPTAPCGPGTFGC